MRDLVIRRQARDALVFAVKPIALRFGCVLDGNQKPKRLGADAYSCQMFLTRAAGRRAR